jgi:hypothetical protein
MDRADARSGRAARSERHGIVAPGARSCRRLDRLVVRDQGPDPAALTPRRRPDRAQLEVRFADGRLLACLDAGLPEWKIGVESHSKRWHFGDRKNVLDADRDNELTVLGWETIYIRRKQAYTRGEVRRIVGGAIETRRRTVAPSTQPAYLATQLGVR